MSYNVQSIIVHIQKLKRILLQANQSVSVSADHPSPFTSRDLATIRYWQEQFDSAGEGRDLCPLASLDIVLGMEPEGFCAGIYVVAESWGPEILYTYLDAFAVALGAK